MWSSLLWFYAFRSRRFSHASNHFTNIKHLRKSRKFFQLLWIISVPVRLCLTWTFIQKWEILKQGHWRHRLLPIPITFHHLHFLFLRTFVSIQPVLYSSYCMNRSHCNCTDQWISNLNPFWVYECHYGTTLKHNMLWWWVLKKRATN